MPKRFRSTAHRRKAVAAAGVLVLLTAAACSSQSSTTSSSVAAAASGSGAAPAAAAGKSITTAWPADITSLDPANLSTGQDHELTRNIYQTLESPAFAVQSDGSLKFVGANVKPMLAKSWTIGAASITYHLREGVKFYGTSDVVTAEDVKWSLGRIFSTPGAGDLKANGLQSPDDIHVVDANTVTINFKTTDGKPTPVTPTLMAIFDQPYTSIINENAVKPHITTDDPTGAKWLRANAAGTGPYYIASREVGSSFQLKAVPSSWAPAPSYPEVDIRITSGSVPSLLQSGDINFGEYGMTNEQVNSLQTAGLNVVWQNTGNFDMFAITAGPASDVGALGNTSVRQAIAYAIPYDQILKNVIYGRGARDNSIVSPSAPEYTPAWSKYTTDLTKAKSLMTAAGNPSLNLPLYYLQGDVDQTNTAILIQASLKNIGITTTLTPETQAGLFDVVDARSTPATGSKVGPPRTRAVQLDGLDRRPEDRHRLLDDNRWYQQLLAVVVARRRQGQRQLRPEPDLRRTDRRLQAGSGSHRRRGARHPDRVHRRRHRPGQGHQRSVLHPDRIRPLLDPAPDRHHERSGRTVHLDRGTPGPARRSCRSGPGGAGSPPPVDLSEAPRRDDVPRDVSHPVIDQQQRDRSRRVPSPLRGGLAAGGDHRRHSAGWGTSGRGGHCRAIRGLPGAGARSAATVGE